MLETILKHIANTSRTLTKYDLPILAIQRSYQTLCWRPVGYDFMDTGTPQMSCQASGAYGPTAEEMLPRLHESVNCQLWGILKGILRVNITYIYIYIYIQIYTLYIMISLSVCNSARKEKTLWYTSSSLLVSSSSSSIYSLQAENLHKQHWVTRLDKLQGGLSWIITGATQAPQFPP